MIIYNPKEWFSSTTYFHRSDTFRKLLPFILLIAVYSWAIAYLEIEYLRNNEKEWIKNITTVHSLTGFALSLLLVFRTNTGYDRWWEARKQWGELTNLSRNLAIEVNAILPENDKVNRSFFKKAIPLYASTLFSFLKSDYSRFMLDTSDHPDIPYLDTKKHGPNQVASLIARKINFLYREAKITDTQYYLLSKQVTRMTNVVGACERIKNTPIPLAYSSFIKKFIIVYVATLPIGYVFTMGYLVVAAVPFVFYVLTSLELIAESIEDPFGNDADDLPIDKIADNIDKHVQEIIES
ncbi:hypothetical protein J5U18_08380 [Sphingobacteriaceae bacterium WQ 2009]|uniref:Bestrophin n=1 Tax=Rhinopithecimicrobium faecis TaxID=2820698 RepID=A0A8T4HBC5_9SPHI|nr:hypothetical protein [Sphingobacteriaceae bacterium WQ 2009]